MMPWEHAAVGYISYSLLLHGCFRGSPSSSETVVLAVAAVFPDLVDKPLAWQFDVFAGGHALGHSLFFALPFVSLLLWLTWLRGRVRLGIAFAVGYLLHLPGDVVPPYLLDGAVRLDRMFWPLGSRGTGYESGFTGEFLSNLSGYVEWIVEQTTTGNPDPYFLVLLGIGVFGTALWIYDGMPVGRDIARVSRQFLRSVGGAVRGE